MRPWQRQWRFLDTLLRPTSMPLPSICEMPMASSLDGDVLLCDDRIRWRWLHHSGPLGLPCDLAIHGNGDGGIVAWNGLPLIAADLIRLQQLRPMAEKVAKASGHSIRLVRFTTRTEIDVIEP